MDFATRTIGWQVLRSKSMSKTKIFSILVFFVFYENKNSRLVQREII